MYHRSGEGCQKLGQGVVDELRGRIKTILKKARTPRKNITKEECKAIGELKRDDNRLVLTADKGVALVVMDKEDDAQKAKELLDQPTYRPITNDPTTKYKNKFVNLLKAIKLKGKLMKHYTENCIPQGQDPLHFMASPRYIKNNPLEANTIQYRTCQLWDFQGTGQDSETPSGKVHIPCP